MYGKRKIGGLSPSRSTKRSKISAISVEDMFDNAIANSITDRTTPGHRDYDAGFHLAMAGDPDIFKLHSELKDGLRRKWLREQSKAYGRARATTRMIPVDYNVDRNVSGHFDPDVDVYPGNVEWYSGSEIGVERHESNRYRWDMNPIEDAYGNPQSLRNQDLFFDRYMNDKAGYGVVQSIPGFDRTLRVNGKKIYNQAENAMLGRMIEDGPFGTRPRRYNNYSDTVGTRLAELEDIDAILKDIGPDNNYGEPQYGWDDY